MNYYKVEDIKKITGTTQNKSYEIIRELNKQIRIKYPDSIPIQGQVLKWYFEEAMGLKGDENNEKKIASENFN